jgi:hypothetical protein
MGNSNVGAFDRFGCYRRFDERDGFVHFGDEGISGSANTAAPK